MFVNQEENYYQWAIFKHIEKEHLTKDDDTVYKNMNLEVIFNFNYKYLNNESEENIILPLYSIINLKCNHTDFPFSSDKRYNLTKKQII
jgi:hypothetical protein